MMLYIVQQMEEVLVKLDQWANRCYEEGIDCGYLLVAENALLNQITVAKESLIYKMEQYDLYGEPLDDTDVDEIKVLIEEIGYDSVLALFGESVGAVLSEATAEEASYRG